MITREQVADDWKASPNGRSSQDVWDAAAEGYSQMPVPGFDDPFLSMLEEEVLLTRELSVLDVGCGSGVYSLALAEKVGKVTGCDFSPKMIEAAETKADKLGCDNVDFRVGDFRELDFPDSYDLVFAHLTPAVCDTETFDKFCSVSRCWCYMAKPVRRTDHVLERARVCCGLPPTSDGFDRDFLCAFALVWLDGKTPSMRHYKDVWNDTYELDEAISLYCDRLVEADLDSSRRQIVKEFLTSIADEEGIVHERIDTTVVMMGWQV